MKIENLNKLLFSKSDISIDILNAKDLVLNITDEDIKNYWEANKNNYKSEPAFELETKEVPLLSQTFTQEEISENYSKFKIRL